MTETEKLIIWTGYYQLATGILRIGQVAPGLAESLETARREAEEAITGIAGPPPDSES